MAKNKCECNFWWSTLAVILFVLGLYFLVLGFLSQAAGLIALNWTALLYYLIGFALFAFGKMAKCSGCFDCKVHPK